jgi:hypothetical protein
MHLQKYLHLKNQKQILKKEGMTYEQRAYVIESN